MAKQPIKKRKPGSGGPGRSAGLKKKYTDHVSMEVRLPEGDKTKLRVKYGRGFNEVFRQWVKTLIGDNE